MLISLFILFLLWLCFGSFSTVLVSRWQSGQTGIMTGRSECPTCKHILWFSELFPVLSWLIQWGKCKNCKNSIPSFYPLSELFMGVLFVWSWWIAYWFGYTWDDLMWWVFLFWTFVTGIYIIYDLRYMEIPDQIMVPAILITLIFILWGLFWSEYAYFFDISSYHTFHTFLTDHISSAIFLYSFFFLQILIPGTLFLIRQQSYRAIPGLLLSYFTFPFVMLFEFFRGTTSHRSVQDEQEIPSWIGWWDLRIALFIGLTLWSIHTLSTILIAYVIWSIAGLTLIFYAKLQHKKVVHEVPFGPFLGIGWVLSLSLYSEILDYVHVLYM